MPIFFFDQAEHLSYSGSCKAARKLLPLQDKDVRQAHACDLSIGSPGQFSSRGARIANARLVHYMALTASAWDKRRSQSLGCDLPDIELYVLDYTTNNRLIAAKLGLAFLEIARGCRSGRLAYILA